MAADVARLVDTERGLIGRRIFIEPEIYQHELERVFAAAGCFCVTTARSPSPVISLPPIWAKTRFWWFAIAPGRCTPF